MDFEMGRNDLLAPLQAVLGAVELRQTMPILSNVLIELSGGSMECTASDGQLQVTVVVDGQCGGDARALTVPLRKLVEILRLLPADAQVRLGLHGARLRVSCAGGRWELRTTEAS